MYHFLVIKYVSWRWTRVERKSLLECMQQRKRLEYFSKQSKNDKRSPLIDVSCGIIFQQFSNENWQSLFKWQMLSESNENMRLLMASSCGFALLHVWRRFLGGISIEIHLFMHIQLNVSHTQLTQSTIRIYHQLLWWNLWRFFGIHHLNRLQNMLYNG